ncbi:MAG: aminotransferase class I/II-fold pyridoxal phosphate-dependent enzyme [Streptosporangiaceae bacterium]
MPRSADVFAKAREHEDRARLKLARELGVMPYFHVLQGEALPVADMEGRRRIMLGSNNYLGLTADERVKQGAREALDRYGTGLTGSRFYQGTTPLHLELELELAGWLGAEAALVFTTGYQANTGAISAILRPGDTVIADSGDHASIIDGCTLSQATFRRFRHNQIEGLENALEEAAADGGGVLVVVDGVFSMEGDVAPLREIADACRRASARLMVDEAHALGVLGVRGAGACELLAVEDRTDLRMATFSKSLASCGGVIAGPADVIEFLRLSARPFIFTSSAVPAALGAALAAVRICRSDEGRQLSGQVLRNARYWRAGLRELGFRVPQPDRPAGATDVLTPIVPVVVGEDWNAAFLWAALYEAGVFVNTAIHPAVPRGRALLRTSVMAAHERATLDAALEIFGRVRQQFEAEHGPLPGPE